MASGSDKSIESAIMMIAGLIAFLLELIFNNAIKGWLEGLFDSTDTGNLGYAILAICTAAWSGGNAYRLFWKD